MTEQWLNVRYMKCLHVEQGGTKDSDVAVSSGTKIFYFMLCDDCSGMLADFMSDLPHSRETEWPVPPPL